MPISIVVGGQFGSEGKGKVALELVRRSPVDVVVVRVGGPNSGHTAHERNGSRHVLRQMPAACLDRNVDVVLPAGSYIDVELLLDEIAKLSYSNDRIHISPLARLVRSEHKEWEVASGLQDAIGSTGTGVGASVMATVARGANHFGLPFLVAKNDPRLRDLVRPDLETYISRRLSQKHRIIVEGTQGFGLSLFEGGYWPNVTSRSTTAAGALSETALSPMEVDEVVMVIRAFPIRVAGASGPLANETTWERIAEEAGRDDDFREYTSVTGRLRRVGRFDPGLVRRALSVNSPTRLVLNHLDYIGREEEVWRGGSKVRGFLSYIEKEIGHTIEWLGFSSKSVVQRGDWTK